MASPDSQAAWEAVGGDIVPYHEAVYIIVITGGTFTADRHPSGVPAPQGGVLTLSVDAATYIGMGSMISNIVPDLSKISSDIVDLSTDIP